MQTILNGLIFILIADAWLYWTHRISHKFFPKQHALHHKYKFKTVFHSVDHIFNWGIFPFGWLVGFTTTEMLPVIVWGIMFTFISHREKKNYKAKPGIIMRTVDHESHHDSYNKNYGVLFTLWDRTMGTYI